MEISEVPSLIEPELADLNPELTHQRIKIANLTRLAGLAIEKGCQGTPNQAICGDCLSLRVNPPMCARLGGTILRND